MNRPGVVSLSLPCPGEGVGELGGFPGFAWGSFRDHLPHVPPMGVDHPGFPGGLRHGFRGSFRLAPPSFRQGSARRASRWRPWGVSQGLPPMIPPAGRFVCPALQHPSGGMDRVLVPVVPSGPRRPAIAAVDIEADPRRATD